MNYYPKTLGELTAALSLFPGIGKKSAQRLAFYLLNCPKGDVARLLTAIQEARSKIVNCQTCFGMSETPECPICRDQSRDKSIICVLANPNNLFVLESAGVYKGLYHVLGGLLSPLDGIGPEHLRIRELLNRVKQGGVREVILALSSNVEGESTAAYLKRLLDPVRVRISRIASGIPVGGELEYADEITLARSLEGRLKY